MEIERLRTRQASSNGAVQWVDPRVFAQMGVEAADPAAAPAVKVPGRFFAIPWEASGFSLQKGTILLLLRTKIGTVAGLFRDHSSLPGPWSRGPLSHLRRGLRRVQRCGTPPRLGSRPADRLAGLRPGRIRRATPGWRTCREYRLRVDDQLDMIYRLTRDETPSRTG